MSIITSGGKVTGMFVSHNGVKKEVQSGWINQNGVEVPFYRKESQLPFDSITVTNSKYKVNAGRSELLFDAFDLSNVNSIKVIGQVSSYHYSPYYTGTTTGELILVSANNEFENVLIATVSVSGKSTASISINNVVDVRILRGMAYFEILNNTQTKRYTYDITFTCSA